MFNYVFKNDIFINYVLKSLFFKSSRFETPKPIRPENIW